ncbi:MAG TPA: hypothetical protein VKM54_25415 [Myxococcota bacterium]|nr:hypothetical protein [Myxococcota bacterium]
MSNIFSMIVGVLLLLGAATHVYRMCCPFAFIVGRYNIPRWYSLPFAASEAYAGLMLLNMALT